MFQDKTENKPSGVKPNPIKSHDFPSWDKYDANQEVKKIDEEEKNKKEDSDKKPNWSDELTEQGIVHVQEEV